MANLVPCRLCGEDFDYAPGIAGNARQLCEQCLSTIDEKELKRLEDETIIEGNRYFVDAPRRKDEYDPLDILVDGNMPEFESDADRFICAAEITFFLRKQKGGFCGMEKNTAKLMEHIGITHSVVMIRQWTLTMMEYSAKNEYLKPYMDQILRLVQEDNKIRVEDPPGFWSYKTIEPKLTRTKNGWECKE